VKYFVTAKPGARVAKLIQIDENHFNISVKEPPIQGRANAAIYRALADHLGIPLARLKLISGYSSRQKVFSDD
jgi:uncharacterized protein